MLDRIYRSSGHQRNSDTDIFTGAGGGHVSAAAPKTYMPHGDLIELGLEDEWLEAVTYVEVGPNGERIDKKEYITNWEKAVRASSDSDEVLKKIRTDEELTLEEELLLSENLNKPEMYFNEENLRRAYKKPGGTLIDFIRAALGRLKIKSREEELTENFQTWLVTKNLSPEQAQYLSLLKNRGIVKGKVELTDLFQPPLSILNAARVGIELFGERNLKEIIEDMNSSVFSKKTA